MDGHRSTWRTLRLAFWLTNAKQNSSFVVVELQVVTCLGHGLLQPAVFGLVEEALLRMV